MKIPDIRIPDHTGTRLPLARVAPAWRVLVLGVAIVFLAVSPAWCDAPPCGPCVEFNDLNNLVRDGVIGRTAAQAGIRRLLPLIGEYYAKSGARAYAANEWVFPVDGYTMAVAGSNRGRDYVASGYDYFSGNRHGGHPSFDLFIRDRNRDCLDDATGAPVKVRSMTGGVVVAQENDWSPGSGLRGGTYIWIFDPASDALVYYAHNATLTVKIGEIVRPGDVIATVGRTGYNAYRKRSPTHLHLTFLKVRDGYPRPVNIYRDLKRVGVVH